MKKLSLTIIVIFFGISFAFSQPLSNLVFFSEDGYPFHVIMNGIKENPDAQTNVKITNLPAPNYKVKIIFEDQTIPSIEKNIYTKPDMEVTYAIKKTKKGEMTIRYYSEAPRPYEQPVNNDVVVIEGDTDTNTDVVVVTNDVSDNSGGVHIDMNMNESGISYNVVTDEGGVNVNIDINDANMDYDANVTEYETHYEVEEGYSDGHDNVYHMPGYSGPVGCNWPMDPGDFQRAKQTISNASFDEDKLTISKQVVGMNCLTVEQIKQIGMMFDFEDNKLEFAKFAWGRTYDLGNYFMLNDIFDFSSSIDELNDYINSH